MPRNGDKRRDEEREGPLSLAPLTFGEAVDALLQVKPEADRPKKRKKKLSTPKDEKQGMFHHD